MARHEAVRRAGEAPVGEQRHGVAEAGAVDGGGHAEHLAHAGAADGPSLRITTTSPSDDAAVGGGLHRRLLAVEHARGAGVQAPLVAGELHDAALGREVAAQDREAAGRLQRVVERADDALAGRLGGRVGDLPHRLAGHGDRVRVQDPELAQALDEHRHTARLVQVDATYVPPGLRSHSSGVFSLMRVEVVDHSSTPASRATATVVPRQRRGRVRPAVEGVPAATRRRHAPGLARRRRRRAARRSARAVLPHGGVFVLMPEGGIAGPVGDCRPSVTGAALIALRTEAPDRAPRHGRVRGALRRAPDGHARPRADVGPRSCSARPGRTARPAGARRAEFEVARRLTERLEAILGPVVGELTPGRVDPPVHPRRLRGLTWLLSAAAGPAPRGVRPAAGWRAVSSRRMQYAESILDLVGHTPLVRLTRVTRDLGPAERQPLILAKLEMLNPGGSVKDRIGLPMIEAAERDGLLKPGGTIIEPTAATRATASRSPPR